MPNVRFLPDNKSVQVRPGTNLLEVARRARVAVRTRCGGKASCLQCRVTVPDQSGLTPPSDQERRKLGEVLLQEHIRLACQAACVQDVTVVLPEDPLKAAVRAQLERQKGGAMQDEG